MSSGNSPGPAPVVAMEQPGVAEPYTSRKSYRRKYRKIMVTFEEKMRESNNLFKDEQRIFDISQRLAEQTDQLLQMLVELNTCPQVPNRIRYNLGPPKHLSPKLKPLDISLQERDEEETHLALRRARHRLQIGEIGPSEYTELQEQVLDASNFAPGKLYSQLAKNAPSPTTTYDEDRNQGGKSISGFLTAKQEDIYLQGLDAFLDGNAATTRPHAASSLGNRNAERTTEREKEMQLRNPVSVYNWLRKNQPQVFLQDNEPSGDKPTKAPGSRSSKRMANKDSLLKAEPEMYDDDGVAAEASAAMRGKRKRDDDGGYRPKGGNSRPSKRKKEDAGTVPPPPVRKGKKMSIDAK